MAETFPNLRKYIDVQTQDAPETKKNNLKGSHYNQTVERQRES